MKKKIRGFLVGAVVGVIAVVMVATMTTRNMALDNTYTYLKLFNEVLSLVRTSYVDEVEPDPLLKGAYEGMLSELDPFSEYLTPEEYQKYVVEHGKDRSAVGVGLRIARRAGLAIVVSVRPGSEAESKGITSGDLIRRIQDEPVRGRSLYEIRSLLEGKAGSKVSLSLARRTEPRKLDVELTRAVEAPLAVKLEIVDPEGGLAVLTIPDFRKGVADMVASELEAASSRKVARLLIDLRGNAWGDLEEAARTAGLFLGDTVVATLESKQGKIEDILGGRSKTSFSGAVSLLINSATADAAEVFSAALRDGRGAVLMGETSFGVGAQQDFIPLKNGAYVSLSVRKFVSPSGESWHIKGLEPERKLEITEQGMSHADIQRMQLEQAIELLRHLELPAAKVAGSKALAKGDGA